MKVEMYPSKSVLKSQLPVPLHVTLFGNKVFGDDQDKIRSLPQSNITGILMKGEIWTEGHMCTKGRWCEDTEPH